MIKTRAELKKYALELCTTMMERTASRYDNGILPVVTDHKGYIPTFLEEFCRPFWGMAPIIAEESEDIILSVNGEDVMLADWVFRVMDEGLSPDTEHTWDRYRYTGAGPGLDFQNVTEIAGLLIGLYFCREKVWDRFPDHKKQMFADRIFSFCSGECEHLAENNHIWFPMFCVLVLKKLGFSYPNTDHYLSIGLERLEDMYISDGWYSDGDFGRFDYYTVWSMHAYPLIWTLIEDETFKEYEFYRKKYLERTEKFLNQYIYAFDIDGGMVPMGRSLVYRFAAVCIFPLAAMAGCTMDLGLARRITLKNISYFKRNIRLNDSGILPTGYFYEAPGLVESYTADGGAYWCAKTFLCLLMDENHPFWSAEETPAPIEKDDYLVRPLCEKINLTVGGTKNSGITIYNNVSQYYQRGIYCNPFNDMASYYCKFAYNSRSGFGVSTHDNICFDNMISLQTPERSMASHRWGFVDLGLEGELLLSYHLPFANDKNTRIVTAMLPLLDGCHVRLHKVTLSQEYNIREGGFSVPLWNDYHTETLKDSVYTMENGSLYSVMTATATVPLTFYEYKPQPAMHLLAPLSRFPAYETGILKEGTYYFASAYCISTEKENSLPELDLSNTLLKVTQKGETREIPLKILDK